MSGYSNFNPGNCTIDDTVQSADNELSLKIGRDLETRRKNFHFTEDFSFSIPEYSREVLALYGRHTFDWDKLGRKEKKKVRHDYQQKVKEYFIEFYDWPPAFAAAISSLAGLPNHRTQKKAPKKVLDFAINAVIGSLPEKYADAVAKIMNEDRKVLTKDSIYFDAAEILFVGSAAAAFWMGSAEVGSFEQAYNWLGIEKESLKWWMTGATAFRTLEVAVRTAVYKTTGKHTPSPAIIFPFNPSLSRGGLMLGIFCYDIVNRVADANKPFDLREPGADKAKDFTGPDNYKLTDFSKPYKAPPKKSYSALTYVA